MNYLAHDRPDLKRAALTIATKMASPLRGDWRRLKRVARYLLGRPELGWKFPWQSKPKGVGVYSDADWGGDRKSRRSTSGGIILAGSHLIKCWSKAQHAVSLSSAEAELYAAVRTASEAIGAESLMEDLGMSTYGRPQVGVDASAAIAMITREGLGAAKHIDKHFLWIQEATAKGKLEIQKVHTQRSPADMFTKQLTERKVVEYLTGIGCRCPFQEKGSGAC